MTQHEEFKFYYCPCSSENEAKSLAESLLRKKYIACANIIPKIHSMYRWDGEIKYDQEALLILKTTSTQVNHIQSFIASHHSYDTFCLIRIESDFINPEYLQWVKEQVSSHNCET
jgi:periplasmic divalent cation tolerance protein